MVAEVWEMKTLNIAPYEGTKIFCCNDGDDKRVFVMSNYYYPLYIKLWCDSHTQKSAVIELSYGIGGFYIPSEFIHSQIQIGTSADNEDWHWTIHNYHNGGTK